MPRTRTMTARPICKLIANGRITGEAASLEQASRCAAAPGSMALHLYPAPAPEQLRELADAWQLHPVLTEDLLHAGQRPKLERYGDTLLLVLRSAIYLDAAEEVELSEFHVLLRGRELAIICQDGRWFDGTSGVDLEVPAELLEEEADLKQGPEAMLYQLLDEIVDGYRPVLSGLGIDKEQIEAQVFTGDKKVTERIYRLSQEVIDMQHATAAMLEVANALAAGFEKYQVPAAMQTYLQDVQDHLVRAHGQTVEYREALAQILNVNATLVAQQQNEDMKKISGWAAILFTPTLVAAIYGMNFDVMPELHWAYGYPVALGLMAVLTAGLYGIFKWRKWF